MGRKRPERTEKRVRERAARALVKDRERLAAHAPGAEDHPIDVTTPSVIETRLGSLHCPQCDGDYQLNDHQSPAPGMRTLAVTCKRCHVSRKLWFRLISNEPN